MSGRAPGPAARVAPQPTSWRQLAGWLLRFGLAFAFLNALLSFENRWPGFGVHPMPRLSFELCLAVAALMGWVAWRGGLGTRAASGLATGFLLLVAVRYADVTAPAVLGRPVNVYWDGRHALDLLGLARDAATPLETLAFALGLLAGGGLIWLATRRALLTLAGCLAWPRARPVLLAAVALLSASFAAYVPDVRDTRWFFTLPLTPTLLQQSRLIARVMMPQEAEAVLGASPAFDTGLGGLEGPAGRADVLLVFAESYGAISFDQPDLAAALAGSRAAFAGAASDTGRGVVSARVRAPTFGGASWLSHASLLSGLAVTGPDLHALLLTTRRPTLVGHFARHGYRTIAWMPGLKRAWPEGRFYGFDRVADDAGIGYRGPDFGYWRIPDQAAMAALHHQELTPAAGRAPRFVVFPTTSTHAPFHPLAPVVDDWARLLGPEAYTAAQATAALAEPVSLQQPGPHHLEALRYQFDWLGRYLRERAQDPLVLVLVGDHQPPALVTGPGASWDVPVHIVSRDAALLQRLLDQGFVRGLEPPTHPLGPMHALTGVLLQAFDGSVPRVPDGAPAPTHPLSTRLH